MDATTRSRLRLVGVQLSLVAAALHLAAGLPRTAIYLRIGRMPDPRMPLFVLSALVVGAAVVRLHYGGRERPIYALLAAVMLLYVAGYVGWHLAGHPTLGSNGLRTTPSHSLAVIAAHLANDLLALVSLLVELGAITALAALLVDHDDGATGDGDTTP